MKDLDALNSASEIEERVSEVCRNRPDLSALDLRHLPPLPNDMLGKDPKLDIMYKLSDKLIALGHHPV